MPSNQILINNAVEYYVGDSKIEELMEWLEKNGFKGREEPVEKQEQECKND